MLKTLLFSAAMAVIFTSCQGASSKAATQSEEQSTTINTTNDGDTDATGTNLNSDGQEGSSATPSEADRDSSSSPASGSATNASDNPEVETSASIAIPSFTPNDVTILFPAPNSPSDVMLKITDFEADKVLSQAKFDETIRIATGTAGTVKGTRHRIGFRSTPRRSDWVVSGIRIDPSAPGASQAIVSEFGKSPQLRLVLQPITQVGSRIQVEDITLHLVFAYHAAKTDSCRIHENPDMVKFEEVVSDLKAIKDRFAADHNVDTSGNLNVHPAFDIAPTEFKNALKDYLNTHASMDDLFAVSIAGIPQRFEPWIFLAMANRPSGLIPIPSPAIIQTSPTDLNFSQMLSFVDPTRVQPAPATHNQGPMSCETVSMANRVGTSTARVFDGNENIDIIGPIIADATKSHFFNTDCVSCHTETRKQIDEVLSRHGRDAKAREIAARSGIDPRVIPHGNWNVLSLIHI